MTTTSAASLFKQLHKGQDFVLHGSTDSYSWQVLCDGHGKNTVIDWIRSLNWEHIMSLSDSFTTFLKLYNDWFKVSLNSMGSGSTLIMVKIFADRVETISIGDSRVFIYKNGELAYTNSIHNFDNEKEQKRLEHRKDIHIQVYKRLYIVDANKLTEGRGQYYIFENNEKISSTQMLGHNLITGLTPERHIEHFTEADHVRVVTASGGFMNVSLCDNEGASCSTNTDLRDMMHMTAEELIVKMEKRFKQEWHLHNVDEKPELFCLHNLPVFADISVAVWDNRQPV